jgi:hypothetical protein
MSDAFVAIKKEIEGMFEAGCTVHTQPHRTWHPSHLLSTGLRFSGKSRRPEQDSRRVAQPQRPRPAHAGAANNGQGEPSDRSGSRGEPASALLAALQPAVC